MNKKKVKKLPNFKSELEERHFWENNDTADYFELGKGARVVFPNLKPSTTAISIRLPDFLLRSLKLMANKRDIPYQSLIKHLLYQDIKEELKL